MRTVSIAMSYVNRYEQLISTLYSIQAFGEKNIEVVITDDASSPPLVINEKFNFTIKIIRIPQKRGMNPCYAYNEAFKACDGEIVIIQNPECLHLGNIISCSKTQCNNSNYLSFACYSAGPQPSRYVQSEITKFDDKTEFLKLISDEISSQQIGSTDVVGRYNCWFNHSIIRPVNYHFCTAITRDNLLGKLGGFDEKYINGHGFDDNELLHRINLLGLKIIGIDNPFTMHLYHETTHHDYRGEPINAKLFAETKRSTTIKANEN